MPRLWGCSQILLGVSTTSVSLYSTTQKEPDYYASLAIEVWRPSICEKRCSLTVALAYMQGIRLTIIAIMNSPIGLSLPFLTNKASDSNELDRS